MATKKLPKNVMLFRLSMALLSTIFPSSCCTLAVTTTIFQGTSTDFIDSTIGRYMREMNNDSSLVHFIIQTSTEDNFVEKVVNRYSSYEIPLMLLSLDPDGQLTQENINLDPNPRQCLACLKFRHVVGIFQTLFAIRPEILKIRYNEIWNPDATFAIFVKDETSIDVNSAERLLRNFWSSDCANVILVNLQLSTVDKIKIFAYDPFSVVTITNRSTNVYAKRGIVYSVESEDSLFPEKFNNLRGHVVPTSFYRHRPHASLNPSTSFGSASGMDVEIIRYAARRLNFTIFIRTEDVDATSHVVRLPNGRRVGPIGDILTGKSEYLGNGQFLEVVHLYNHSLDFVYPYWRSYSVIVVRKAPPLPAIFHWLRERNASLVLWIGGIGLVVFIVYLRMVKKERGGKILLTILGLLLFQHLPNISRRQSDRIFCLVWICCSFVICTIYQGNLVNDLTGPPIYDNIDTLKELVDRTESSFRLMVRPYERRILECTAAISIGDEPRKRLSERTVVQLNFSACLSQMRLSNNVACTIDKSYANFALGQVLRYRLMLEKNPDTRITSQARVYLIPPIHIIDEGLIDFWKTYVVRRHFPYLRAINDAISRSVEFGLVDKWLRDDKEAHFREPPSSKEPRTLSLLHMDFTFAILIFGYVVATVTFLGELAIARIAQFC